ncbi:hypothetical protein BCV70DRAFT_197060 [Testicularia cyperi]|uniref:Uncharacterized protein n=1 Tax=Testicularia cyperi TaxID=1882483 RepID=A0A317XZK9_9BASI|nr:hypothetical protein BCV70DRAFT_197060 [Testicularia cyperi]
MQVEPIFAEQYDPYYVGKQPSSSQHSHRSLGRALSAMKLEHNPLGALKAKGRLLRRKGDRHRIESTAITNCAGGPSGSPRSSFCKRRSLEDAERSGLHSPSFDSFCSAAHYSGSNNNPILLGDDKELHDPNFVRHNWEMMTGESGLFDDDGRHHLHPSSRSSSSPRYGQSQKGSSRRSTFSSSRASSSRPSSRSGSIDNGAGQFKMGLGLSAFDGLSSYSMHGSGAGRRNTQSSSTRGLQVEGSILRDEEAILDGDSSSDDDDDEDDYDEDDDDEQEAYTPPSRSSSMHRRRSPLSPGSPFVAVGDSRRPSTIASFPAATPSTSSSSAALSAAAAANRLQQRLESKSVPSASLSDPAWDGSPSGLPRTNLLLADRSLSEPV